MKSDDWKKVKEIFIEALEVEDGAQRQQFVSDACANHAELQSEVESLLASHEDAKDFYETPAAAGLITAVMSGDHNGEARELDDMPERFGNYKIIREIGRGGMGMVYLAARDDDQFRKQVAVKFIRRHPGNREAVRRFRDERQILARLEHPNIARLLDGGITASDNSPFLVMEYIEGLPLLEYCERRNLSIEERLKIFRKICRAVHYAHRHLVIHRDLKPANILVTADGEPKLLDFGIAKLSNPDLVGDATETLPANRLLTPQYASPEQIRGETVSTATDIYSLGVILYELLTGIAPFRLKDKGFDEIARILSETNPVRPSSVILRPSSLVIDPSPEEEAENLTRKNKGQRTKDQGQPANLKSLRGDLDNIVLMAMRRDPERRYKSAEQFEEDIRRHLEGLPVIARQDTFLYRAGKFINRNRPGVAAALVVLLALIGGLSATLWQANAARAQARLAAEERDRAQLAQTKSERINAFLQNMLGAAAPENQGRDVKVIEVLEKAERQANTELSEQPEVLASVLHTLGRTYDKLVQFEAAERNFRAALVLNRQINSGVVSGGGDRETASCLVDLADLLLQTKRAGEAAPLLREAVEIERRFVPESSPELAKALAQLGRSEREQGNDRAAEPLLQEAVQVAARSGNGEDENTLFALNEIALIRSNAFDFRGMEEIYRRAIPILRKDPRQKAILGTALANLGIALLNQNKIAEAEAALLESLAIRREAYGENNLAEAHSLGLIGRLRLDQTRYQEAREASEKALEIQKKSLPPNHQSTTLPLATLGSALTAQKQAPAGEPFLRQALEINRKIYPPEDWRISNLESQLGECLQAQRRFEEAEPLLVSSYEKLRDKSGEKTIFTTKALLRLIKFYEETAQPDKAARYRALLPN